MQLKMSAKGRKDFRRNNASKAEGNRVGRWSNIATQTAPTKGRPDQPHSPALASFREADALQFRVWARNG